MTHCCRKSVRRSINIGALAPFKPVKLLYTRFYSRAQRPIMAFGFFVVGRKRAPSKRRLDPFKPLFIYVVVF